MANNERPFDVTWDDVRQSSRKRKFVLLIFIPLIIVGIVFLKNMREANERPQLKDENIVKSITYDNKKGHSATDSLCALLISLDSTTVLRLGPQAQARCKTEHR